MENEGGRECGEHHLEQRRHVLREGTQHLLLGGWWNVMRFSDMQRVHFTVDEREGYLLIPLNYVTKHYSSISGVKQGVCFVV